MTATEIEHNSRRIKLFIGLPCYGSRSVMWQTAMWLSMGGVLADSRSRFELAGLALVDVCGVDVCRNRIIAEAIQKEANWVLMCDSDTWVEDAYYILQMLSEADRYPNCAVAIGPTPQRGDENDTHLMVFWGEGAKARPVTLEQLGEKLTPVSSGGTALMAINVDFVRQKLKAPWFHFVWRETDDPLIATFTSEDRNFCDKVRAAGGIVVADGRFQAKHLQRPAII